MKVEIDIKQLILFTYAKSWQEGSVFLGTPKVQVLNTLDLWEYFVETLKVVTGEQINEWLDEHEHK